jgi:hypothetical protein
VSRCICATSVVEDLVEQLLGMLPEQAFIAAVSMKGNFHGGQRNARQVGD